MLDVWLIANTRNKELVASLSVFFFSLLMRKCYMPHEVEYATSRV